MNKQDIAEYIILDNGSKDYKINWETVQGIISSKYPLPEGYKRINNYEWKQRKFCHLYSDLAYIYGSKIKQLIIPDLKILINPNKVTRDQNSKEAHYAFIEHVLSQYIYNKDKRLVTLRDQLYSCLCLLLDEGILDEETFHEMNDISMSINGIIMHLN